MAFERNGLSRIGGAGSGGTLWMYNASEAADNAAGPVLQLVSYFDEAADVLQKGDQINVTREVGTAYLHITYVRSISAAGTSRGGVGREHTGAARAALSSPSSKRILAAPKSPFQ